MELVRTLGNRSNPFSTKSCKLQKNGCKSDELGERVEEIPKIDHSGILKRMG